VADGGFPPNTQYAQKSGHSTRLGSDFPLYLVNFRPLGTIPLLGANIIRALLGAAAFRQPLYCSYMVAQWRRPGDYRRTYDTVPRSPLSKFLGMHSMINSWMPCGRETWIHHIFVYGWGVWVCFSNATGYAAVLGAWSDH
jgi:hypothetical protein